MKKIEDLSLLYVEDEDDIRERYGEYFSTRFKEVFLAKDGKEGLALYEDNQPDVLILDINLPKISGLELAKKIRKNDEVTRILLLTARQDKGTLLKAIELKLVTYLEKPIPRASLEDAFQKIENSYNDKETITLLWKGKEDDYSWNSDLKQFFKNDVHIKLTKKETLLFETFIENFMRTFTYEDIHEFAWNNHTDINIPAIKTLIRGIRKKLPNGVLKSMYGIGYYLDKDLEE